MGFLTSSAFSSAFFVFKMSLKNCPLTILSNTLASPLDPVILKAVGKFSFIVFMKRSHSSGGHIPCSYQKYEV